MYKKDENWVSFLGSVAMQNITVCCIQPKTEHPHHSCPAFLFTVILR